MDGSLQEEKVKQLTRTYIQAAQGIHKKMNFNPRNGSFNGKILVNTDIKQPTVIFKSDEYWYSQGYTCKISD